MAIGCLDSLPVWQLQATLYDETHLCYFNPALLKVRLSIALEVTLPHALMSLRDSLLGCLEDALTRAEVQVNAVQFAPHLIALLASVAAATLVATLPARIVERCAPLFELMTNPVPLDLQPFTIRTVWHARSDRDPGTRWLQRLVTHAAAS